MQIVNIFEEAEEKFKQKLVESRASMKRFVAMRSSSSSRATPSASASTAATMSERELETVPPFVALKLELFLYLDTYC